MSYFCRGKVFSRTVKNVKWKVQKSCCKNVTKSLHVKCEKVNPTVWGQWRSTHFCTISNYFNMKIATCKFRLFYCEKEEIQTYLHINLLVFFFLMTNKLQKNHILDRSRMTGTFTPWSQRPFWNGQY